MPIRMKVYHQGKETLVAAADADLIGKTFREGKFKIEVGKFYEGDVVTEERFVSELRLAAIGNFVGKETIDVAKEAGFVADDGILWINGVPHAQFVLMIYRRAFAKVRRSRAVPFATASKRASRVSSARGRIGPSACGSRYRRGYPARSAKSCTGWSR